MDKNGKKTRKKNQIIEKNQKIGKVYKTENWIRNRTKSNYGKFVQNGKKIRKIQKIEKHQQN